MSAVTFKTISDLLADPVLGKLPEVREYRRVRGNDLDENPAFEQGRSYVRDFADAALLAVANARGTCPDCRQLLPENGYCFIYDRAIVGSNYLPDFGCSLFARKDTP